MEWNYTERYKWRRIAYTEADHATVGFEDVVRITELTSDAALFEFQIPATWGMDRCRDFVNSHYNAYLAGYMRSTMHPDLFAEMDNSVEYTDLHTPGLFGSVPEYDLESVKTEELPFRVK